MELRRREFLKASAGAAGLVLLGSQGLATTARAASSQDLAMLIDVSKCVGCWWCYAACKNYNNQAETAKPEPEDPPALAPDCWTSLFALKKGEDDWGYRKEACLHCTDAACVKVCPTGALSYNDLGFVQYDRSKCSGCGYCAQNCPFGIPQLGSNRVTGAGVMDKCTFCIDRVSNGQPTACAEACTTGAITFGKRSDLLKQADQRVAELAGQNPRTNLYGASELGGLHVLYVLDDTPEAYGLPVDPQVPAPADLRDALKWLGIGAAAVAVAGFGLNYLVAKARIRRDSEE